MSQSIDFVESEHVSSWKFNSRKFSTSTVVERLNSISYFYVRKKLRKKKEIFFRNVSFRSMNSKTAASFSFAFLMIVCSLAPLLWIQAFSEETNRPRTILRGFCYLALLSLQLHAFDHPCILRNVTFQYYWYRVPSALKATYS